MHVSHGFSIETGIPREVELRRSTMDPSREFDNKSKYNVTS